MSGQVLGRNEVEATIREILVERGQIPVDPQSLGRNDSLYDAGLTSHATVKIMLALEDRFDVEFPDELLQRSIFDRIANIAEAIEKLRQDA